MRVADANDADSRVSPRPHSLRPMSRARSSSPPPADGSGSKPTPASHLDNGSLSMSDLRNSYRDELAALLTSPALPPSKALVIDRSLSGMLGLISDIEWFKRHGVEVMYYLSNDELPHYVKHLCFLCKPSPPTVKLIIQHIQAHSAESHRQHTYSLIATPRLTVIANKELEDASIKDKFLSIQEFSLDLFPFEWDVLSMEHSNALRELLVDGDSTELYYVARSIMRIQSIHGIIPTVRGKGSLSLKVCQLMQSMRREAKQKSLKNAKNEYNFPAHHDIDELILIDRTADLITPCLTQLTYEGLIDELFAIKHSTIDVDANILGTNTNTNSDTSKSENNPSKQKKKLLLTSTDFVFDELRDLSFRSIGALLQRKLAAVNATFNEKRESMSVSELKNYMTKFKSAHTERQWLTLHVNLADQIAGMTTKSKMFDRRLDAERAILRGESIEECEDYIEHCLYRQDSMTSVLRLLVLMSQSTGIRTKKYEHFKQLFLQNYGYKYLLLLQSLERIQLLSQSKKSFQLLKKSMRLLVENYNSNSTKEPVNINYVYEGYAPLSVRLIEMGAVTVGGWRKMEEIMKEIPGKLFEIKQDKDFITNSHTHSQQQQSLAPGQPTAMPASSPVLPPAAFSSSSPLPGLGLDEGIKPLVLVYFIGGVTFAEISALRWLSNNANHPKEYLVATTKLINGNSFVESLTDTFPVSGGGSASAGTRDSGR